MREIKFRAWDNRNKFMHDWDSLKSTWKFSAIETHEFLTFLQYTGLKDKNGREIYEGDVVEERWHNPLAGGQNVDRYEVTLAPSTLYIMKHSSGEQRWDRTLFMRGNHVEVIGNIYDNPELLNHPKDKTRS
ncbi:hypothetical protein A8F94_17290 [Bacillus sp. FJAT-27225]|uniref:YopX family protein n=1 Tax=Bacillus sp. FJAT-27225 TaxID=1743144 RepID=UPI00080C2E70|nr:YopX family protein [Bacillus sp. FJAT-27225]OCA84452.1 hypothetical protein A8F94_17290 [Bacillus sp. FJAT-27225]